jgi:uncharacterized protein (DUF302 family)
MPPVTITAYAITRTVDSTFDDAVSDVTSALAAEGFGILTTIDVQATLKAKLDLDVAPYTILGACNPQLASRGLVIEPDLGVLLPCNVVVRREGDRTILAAMEPLAALALAGNPELEPIATEARDRLQRAIASVADRRHVVQPSEGEAT